MASQIEHIHLTAPNSALRQLFHDDSRTHVPGVAMVPALDRASKSCNSEDHCLSGGVAAAKRRSRSEKAANSPLRTGKSMAVDRRDNALRIHSSLKERRKKRQP